MTNDQATAYPVEVRKVETTVLETGTDDSTETTFALGAVIEGKFIPFLSKAAGYIEHLHEHAQDEPSAAAPSSSGETVTPAEPSTTEPASTEPASTEPAAA